MGNLDKQDIGGRQQMIMRCIWDLGGQAIVSQIQEEMEKDYQQKISGQGLNTSLNLMMERGLVTRKRKIRQSFIYETAVTEEEFQKQEIARVRDNTFRGSSEAMVKAMLDAGMTEEDKKAIRKLLK